MLEKILHVKNPLTIIAVFAAIAEVFGTAVLPFIDKENQFVFIWFLMIFPLLLVTLFFLTLNFNHRVLYAPSDYDDEDNFMQALRSSQAQPSEKIDKVALEAKAYAESAPNQKKNIQKSDDPIAPITAYSRLEEQVLRKLKKEFKGPLVPDVKIGRTGHKYLFDAIILGHSETYFVEIKFFHEIAQLEHQLRDTAIRMADSITRGRDPMLVSIKNRKILFVLVTDAKDSDYQTITSTVENQFKDLHVPVLIKIYDTKDVEI